MSRMNSTSWADLSSRFARPARVVKEANTTEMKRNKRAQDGIYSLTEERKINPDFYWDELEKEYSL